MPPDPVTPDVAGAGPPPVPTAPATGAVGTRSVPPAASTSVPFPAGLRALWAQRPFRRLWLGQAVSEIGDGLTGLALLIVVYRHAGSAATIAMLSIVTSLPQVVLGLHAGVLVDRWN